MFRTPTCELNGLHDSNLSSPDAGTAQALAHPPLHLPSVSSTKYVTLNTKTHLGRDLRAQLHERLREVILIVRASTAVQAG